MKSLRIFRRPRFRHALVGQDVDVVLTWLSPEAKIRVDLDASLLKTLKAVFA